MNEVERYEKLKEEALNNPPKKVKGCKSCKKKKEITELPPLFVEESYDPSIYVVPTREEIKLAYAEFNSILGVKEDKKPLVSWVYKFLFNEELKYNCRSCKSKQAIRFHNYMKGF